MKLYQSLFFCLATVASMSLNIDSTQEVKRIDENQNYDDFENIGDVIREPKTKTLAEMQEELEKLQAGPSQEQLASIKKESDRIKMEQEAAQNSLKNFQNQQTLQPHLYGKYHPDVGGGDSTVEWWVWVIVAIVALSVIVAIAKCCCKKRSERS